MGAALLLPHLAAGQPARQAENTAPRQALNEPTLPPIRLSTAVPPDSEPAPDPNPIAPIATTLPQQQPAQEPTPVPPPDEPPFEPTLPALPLPPEADEGDSDDAPRPSRPVGVRCNAAPRLENPPRFLSLPFPIDPQMEVFHGWQYTHNKQPQCGIDFGRRDERGALMGFPVLASADGEACADRDDTGSGCVSGFGDRVLIRHQVEGQTYYTYYGHLESISPNIPIGSRSETVRVRRGEVIGYAGDTGTFGGSIHLHYGIANPSFGWYDPYDLWTTAHIYPNPTGSNGLLSGPNFFWTTNPPTTEGVLAGIGGPQASLPADTIAAGAMNVAEWTAILGRQTGVVEIWIDGELRGEADFGPVPGGSNSSFRWEWDTTRERNGPHRVVLRAFGEDSSLEPRLSVTDTQEASFLVTIQNPRGYVIQPEPAATVVGTLPISGWVTVEESSISAVEIWINGSKRAEAAYGLPHSSAGGDYGFVWNWDTTQERDGTYDIIVKAFAANGGNKELPSVVDIRQTVHTVRVQNGSPFPRWSIR